MALEKLLDKYYFIFKLPALCGQISAKNNASQRPKPSPGVQTTGPCLLRICDWTSQMSRPVKDTSTSWSLSALTQCGLRLTLSPTNTHRKDTSGSKGPFKRDYPQIWLPFSIRSDNGPAFIAKIVQGLAKILKIKWKLHTVYRPWCSGKVECLN
jgi:transposase InsO family protein